MALDERIFYTLPELAIRWGKSEDELIHIAAAGSLPLSISYEGCISGLPVLSCQGFLSLYPHDAAKFLLGNNPEVEISRFYDPDCDPNSPRKHFSPITLPENYENLEDAVQNAVPTKLKITRSDLVVMARAIIRLKAEQPEIAKWESAATSTDSDILLKESRLKELQQRHARDDYCSERKNLDADAGATPLTGLIASPILPEEVQSLMQRKLRHLRLVHDRKWQGVMKTAYSKMSEGIIENMRLKRYGKAVTEVPLSVYREVVASAVSMTREWPEIVWGAIVSILEKAPVGPVEDTELNTIVDEYAWVQGQEPFTMRYMDADQFKESVIRELQRYGLTPKPSFERSLSLEAATGRCGIANMARQERERIGIAIAETLLLDLRPTFRGTESIPGIENRIVTPKSGQNNEDPLMGRKAIADHLGVSESTVKNYMKNRGFPFFSQGGRKCAWPSALDGWRTRKKK